MLHGLLSLKEYLPYVLSLQPGMSWTRCAVLPDERIAWVSGVQCKPVNPLMIRL